MDKIPLLMAAGHTLTRRLLRGCTRALHGAAAFFRFALLFVTGTALLFGTMIPILLLGSIPLLIGLTLAASDPCPFCQIHQGLFFQAGLPSSLGILIYLVTLALAYGASLAYAIGSGAAKLALTQGAPTPFDATLFSMLCLGGRAYIGLVNQILTGKLLGQEGMLAAPFVHGWKIALYCFCIPLHFIGMLAMLFRPLATSISLSSSALARAPRSLTGALERLAQESPEVMARHEANALNAHAEQGQPPPEKKRL